MKKNILFLFLLCQGIVLSFQSCELFDPSKNIPSYIQIDTIHLQTQANQGSNSSKIKDAWIYIDNNLQGVYELPCTFPVLLSDNHSIDVKAGIITNGSSSIRSPYPFYSLHSQTIQLVSGKKQYIGKNGVIDVTYIPQAQFALNEDFESNGFKFTSTTGSTTNMVQTQASDEVFEGKRSGKVLLDASHFIFEAVSEKLVLPVNGNPIYIEMNYKTENMVDLSLRFDNSGNMQEVGIGGMYPSYTWGKIYFEISDVLSPYPNAKNIQLLIHAKKDETLNQSNLLFDNIKIVYR